MEGKIVHGDEFIRRKRACPTGERPIADDGEAGSPGDGGRRPPVGEVDPFFFRVFAGEGGGRGLGRRVRREEGRERHDRPG